MGTHMRARVSLQIAPFVLGVGGVTVSPPLSSFDSCRCAPITIDHQGLLFDCGALACQLPPALRIAQSLCTDRLVRIRHGAMPCREPPILAAP
jgi:hypothetical protein